MKTTLYRLEEVLKRLTNDQTALCVEGQLKGDSIYFVDDVLHYEEKYRKGDHHAIGYVLHWTNEHLKQYADTLWKVENL